MKQLILSILKVLGYIVAIITFVKVVWVVAIYFNNKDIEEKNTKQYKAETYLEFKALSFKVDSLLNIVTDIFKEQKIQTTNITVINKSTVLLLEKAQEVEQLKKLYKVLIKIDTTEYQYILEPIIRLQKIPRLK
jgi:hypothetical protein